MTKYQMEQILATMLSSNEPINSTYVQTRALAALLVKTETKKKQPIRQANKQLR
jgi:hypothetical protein